MIVAELIARLSTMDQRAEVVLDNGAGSRDYLFHIEEGTTFQLSCRCCPDVPAVVFS